MRLRSRFAAALITGVGWAIGLGLEIGLLADLLSGSGHDWIYLAIVGSALFAAIGGLIAGLSLGIGLIGVLSKAMRWWRILLLGLIWALGLGGFQLLEGYVQYYWNEGLFIILILVPPLLGLINGFLTGQLILPGQYRQILSPDAVTRRVVMIAFGWSFSLFVFQCLYALVNRLFLSSLVVRYFSSDYALLGGLVGLLAGAIGGYVTAWQGDQAYLAAHTKRHSTREATKAGSIGDLLAESDTLGVVWDVIDERKEKPKRKPKPPTLQINLYVKAIVIAIIVVGALWWLVAPVREVKVFVTPPSNDFVLSTPLDSYVNWDQSLPLLTYEDVGQIPNFSQVWIVDIHFDDAGSAIYTIRDSSGVQAEARDNQLSPLSDYTIFTPSATETFTPTPTNTATPTLGATP